MYMYMCMSTCVPQTHMLIPHILQLSLKDKQKGY